MSNLIDKSAIVAEIERRKHKLLDNIMFERDKEWVVRTAHQLNRIILFLDDLEVKEVDLDKPIGGIKVQTSMESGSLDEVIVTTKYKAQKGEKV